VQTLIHLIVLSVCPTLIWISWKASPVHRNVRYALIVSLLLEIFGSSSRLVLLWAQYFNANLTDYNDLLLLASLARRFYYLYFTLLISGLLGDQKLYPVKWLRYERQAPSTFLVLLGTGSFISAVSASFSFMLTFHLDADSISTSWIEYIAISSMREVKQLQRRSGRVFGVYSLSRIYQLRENIAVMQMILKMGAPVFKYTTPATVFFFFCIALPANYEFARNFSIAMFDWWLALLSLAVAASLPLFDFRFRKIAVQLPLFRRLITPKNVNSTKVFAVKHAVNDVRQASDVHFSILDRD
ncbi:hypothetical protein PMAYCL1PPCAC_08841, partial [Pristionchus mayeri]